MRIFRRAFFPCILAISPCLLLAQAAPPRSSQGEQAEAIHNATVAVSFSHSGAYSIVSKVTGFELRGTLPEVIGNLRIRVGSDALGAYQEMDADYGIHGRTAIIRLYRRRPSILLLDKHKGADANMAPFPDFTAAPQEQELLHASYKLRAFSPIDFENLDAQGPWVFFDRKLNTMVLAPADNFLVAALVKNPEGTMQSGIDPQIAMLPVGFTHGTLLAFGAGINRTLDAWGMDLQKLKGKRSVANDADVVLKKFGYWTDHGAYYYYKFDPSLGYEGTLLAVRDQYRQLGVPIAYMQLDSWWYPKEKGYNASGHNGALLYRADPTIFPDGLDAFHRQLKLPLATHARWISSASPYRTQYRMSKNVIIDPRFWNSTAAYLKQGGVVVYEQDWLNDKARPAIDIAQSHEFLADMADGMANAGLGIQYCMALPGYFLASTQFPNLRTIRTSGDRFEWSHYDNFLYTSELAHAVGLWPWSDVFMSSELPNLVLSTLSAGPVGTGDALGAIDAANLKRVMRADSVILKPDTPLVPIDAMYLADAGGTGTPESPMIALTRTDFGSASEAYLFSYSRQGQESLTGEGDGTTVSLNELGIPGPVYAWDWVAQKGKLISSDQDLQLHYDQGWGYEVLAPVNGAGIALLGDVSKIVPLARKRFTSVSNRGAVEATIVFVAGEKSVTLTGYAMHRPQVSVEAGKIGGLHYDAATYLFSFAVSPDVRAGAHVRIY